MKLRVPSKATPLVHDIRNLIEQARERVAHQVNSGLASWAGVVNHVFHPLTPTYHLHIDRAQLQLRSFK